MPIYEFEELATGKIVELVLPIQSRDDVPAGLKRIIPSRLTDGTSGFSRHNAPNTCFAQVPKALQNMSSRDQSAFTKYCGMPASQIKEVWSRPVPKRARAQWD